jgi:hypothetical protein
VCNVAVVLAIAVHIKVTIDEAAVATVVRFRITSEAVGARDEEEAEHSAKQWNQK